MALQALSVPPLTVLDPLLARRAGTDESTRGAVAAIIGRVREYRDEGVRACAREFDGLDLAPSLWEVPRKEWEVSLQRLPGSLRAAFELAVERVRHFHEHQRDNGFLQVNPDGSVLGTRVLPVDRVGLYIPGGKASYPSTVIMNAVPATVAGVQEIIVVTPPSEFLSDAVLAACALSGATRIFRVGGAQAVAALAHGTETIPRVDVIVGPGNRWVTEAKRQVVGLVGIDGIAGPTELMVLADDGADTQRVALDLVAQAEHDQDAVAWCVTTSPRLARELPAALDRVLASAPRADIARAALDRNGVVVLVPTLEVGAEVVNLKAPEHLEILTDDPHATLGLIRHAGAIFLGDHTPEPVGDYVAGPSHVLPTGGTARFSSPVGVYSFTKRSSVIGYTRERLLADTEHLIALAEAEGLMGHAEAVRARRNPEGGRGKAEGGRQ